MAAGREAGAPDLGHMRRLQLPALQMRQYLLLPMGRGTASRGRSEVGLWAGCTFSCSWRPRERLREGETVGFHVIDVLDVLPGGLQLSSPLPGAIRARQHKVTAAYKLPVICRPCAALRSSSAAWRRQQQP